MTSSRHKLRAALLAVIMVTSVMAIGGLGSATISSSDATISEPEPAPSSDVTVTVTATPDTNSTGFSFTDEINQSVAGISTPEVTVAGESAGVGDFGAGPAANATQGSVTATLKTSAFSPNDEIEITYTITTEDAAGDTVGISGTVTNENTESLPDRSYTVTDSGATPTPTPPPAGETDNPSPSENRGAAAGVTPYTTADDVLGGCSYFPR